MDHTPSITKRLGWAFGSFSTPVAPASARIVRRDSHRGAGRAPNSHRIDLSKPTTAASNQYCKNEGDHRFSTFVPGRIMAVWSRRESGAQHPGPGRGFECGVHGAVTLRRGCCDVSIAMAFAPQVCRTYLIEPSWLSLSVGCGAKNW